MRAPHENNQDLSRQHTADMGAGAGVHGPFLMRDAEAVSLKKLTKPGRSEAKLRRWHRQYGIARQSAPGARLEFSVVAVAMLEHGDLEALAKLRAGDRSDPMVRRYFDLLGLPS